MPKLTLEALRVNYSLSAQEVADELGIHLQTLLKYEKDSSKIPMNIAQKLAKLYKTDMDNIFFGEKVHFKMNLNKDKKETSRWKF